MTSGKQPGIGSSPDSLPPLRDVIERYELRAKKSLGQNFLLDLNITRRIARLCGDLSGRTILEVGPGPGGLTRALLLEGAARVIAVERDERCTPALNEIAARYPGQLDVHFGDALETDWPTLLAGISGPVTIAANLPYGVASMLLAGWMETRGFRLCEDRSYQELATELFAEGVRGRSHRERRIAIVAAA